MSNSICCDIKVTMETADDVRDFLKVNAHIHGVSLVAMLCDRLGVYGDPIAGCPVHAEPAAPTTAPVSKSKRKRMSVQKGGNLSEESGDHDSADQYAEGGRDV